MIPNLGIIFLVLCFNYTFANTTRFIHIINLHQTFQTTITSDDYDDYNDYDDLEVTKVNLSSLRTDQVDMEKMRNTYLPFAALPTINATRNPVFNLTATTEQHNISMLRLKTSPGGRKQILNESRGNNYDEYGINTKEADYEVPSNISKLGLSHFNETNDNILISHSWDLNNDFQSAGGGEDTGNVRKDTLLETESDTFQLDCMNLNCRFLTKKVQKYLKDRAKRKQIYNGNQEKCKNHIFSKLNTLNTAASTKIKKRSLGPDIGGLKSSIQHSYEGKQQATTQKNMFDEYDYQQLYSEYYKELNRSREKRTTTKKPDTSQVDSSWSCTNLNTKNPIVWKDRWWKCICADIEKGKVQLTTALQIFAVIMGFVCCCNTLVFLQTGYCLICCGTCTKFCGSSYPGSESSCNCCDPFAFRDFLLNITDTYVPGVKKVGKKVHFYTPSDEEMEAFDRLIKVISDLLGGF